MSNAIETRPAAIWRTCIDLGTSASKASICARSEHGEDPRLHPLKIGAFSAEASPYLVQSAMLFHRQRVYFGLRAVETAGADDCESELLQSFKMFLAPRDVGQSLALKLKRTTDPSDLFSQRDALTLYTAYILALTERAARFEPNISDEARSSPRRYVYPIWEPDTHANAVVARLFDEADAIAARLGDELVDSQNLSVNTAREALDEARVRPGFGRIEAGVFEAQAAAECHFALEAQTPDFAIVFDMGAGTTDFAAFKRSGVNQHAHLEEIQGVRRTLPLGCDELDNILLAMFIDRAPKSAKLGAERVFWRRLKTRSRRLKESLFRDGACHATHQGKKIAIRLSDFLRDKSFQTFKTTLQGIYHDYLSMAFGEAAAVRAQRIDVIPAGGGAMLPFVQDMLGRPGALGARLSLRVHPNVPTWIKNGGLAELPAHIFPQLAVAIGGAIASLRPSEAHF